jgi:putative DNA primase/helicase
MPDDAASFASASDPEELARFDKNDLGNAKRLIRLAGGTIRPDGSIDVSRSVLLFQLGAGWVGYNGQYWDRKLGEQLARKLAHTVAEKVRGLFHYFVAAGMSSKDAMTFIERVGNRGSTSAMLSQAEPYLTVEIDDFDRDPMALNVRNGTLHLAKVGGKFRVRLGPHDAADRITRFIDVEYDPKAQAPLFRKVVEESLPDEDLRGFFHRAQGYTATGSTHEQAMFICQGLGRDGKSTILDALRETLGSYGAAGTVDSFLDQGGQRDAGAAAPDLVKLAGDVRMVVLSEPTRGAKLAEGRLKAWTSGSPITVRELREKPFEFRPCGKLWMECNSFPVAKGDDEGLWRRLFPVLFEHQLAKDQVDRTIPARLREEFPGVLNWLLEGVEAWLDRGLDPPDKVTRTLDEYRKQSSPFGDWLNEKTVFGPAAGDKTVRTLVADLYSDFKAWAEDQGIDKPMGTVAFGHAMTDRQIGLAGKNRLGRKYRGPIRLKTPEELQADRGPEGPDDATQAGPSAGGALGYQGDPRDLDGVPWPDPDEDGR